MPGYHLQESSINLSEADGLVNDMPIPGAPHQSQFGGVNNKNVISLVIESKQLDGSPIKNSCLTFSEENFR